MRECSDTESQLAGQARRPSGNEFINIIRDGLRMICETPAKRTIIPNAPILKADKRSTFGLFSFRLNFRAVYLLA